MMTKKTKYVSFYFWLLSGRGYDSIMLWLQFMRWSLFLRIGCVSGCQLCLSGCFFSSSLIFLACVPQLCGFPKHVFNAWQYACSQALPVRLLSSFFDALLVACCFQHGGLECVYKITVGLCFLDNFAWFASRRQFVVMSRIVVALLGGHCSCQRLCMELRFAEFCMNALSPSVP